MLMFFFSEYPCEFVSLFVVCQMFSAYSDVEIQQTSLLLLQILRRQFLDNTLSLCVTSKSKKSIDLNNSLSSSTKIQSELLTAKRVFSLGQSLLIDQLGKTYIQLTMPIFSGLAFLKKIYFKCKI